MERRLKLVAMKQHEEDKLKIQRDSDILTQKITAKLGSSVKISRSAVTALVSTVIKDQPIKDSLSNKIEEEVLNKVSILAKSLPSHSKAKAILPVLNRRPETQNSRPGSQSSQRGKRFEAAVAQLDSDWSLLGALQVYSPPPRQQKSW